MGINGLRAESRIESLNQREIEILKLIADGLSNHEIAQKLFLSVNTIKWYNKQIFAKLRVKSRTEAVAMARRFSLLGPAAPLPGKGETRHLHNLPHHLTKFIGREQEIERIKRLLTPAGQTNIGMHMEKRLVMLTGPGGVGKTRLAIRVGYELVELYPHGVWLVELAPLSKPELVAQALITLFGLPEDARRPARMVLADYLREKKALLILDNCEHLIDTCAQLAKHLLMECPDIRVLATSREPLGVQGEVVFRVPSLSLPPTEHPTVESIVQSEAGQLFLDRAAAAKSGFILTEGNAGAIAQVCCRLDGIALAIELAAGWVRLLQVEQIANRLDDAFRLLTGGSRTALPRHQTLRATIDWSYNLLSEAERCLLQRLAVFAGGARLEAIEAICSGDGLEISEVLELLTHLVDKSLVMVDRVQGTAPRYFLLETIRQYAGEKLHENPVAWQLAREKFGNFYASFLDEQGERTKGPEQKSSFDAIAREFENIRLAWRVLVEDKKTDLAVEKMSFALFRYAEIRDKFFDLKPLLDLGIQKIEEDTYTNFNPNLLPILLLIGPMFYLYGQSGNRFIFKYMDQKEIVRRVWRLTDGDIEVIKGMGYWGILLCYLACRVDIQLAVEYLGQLQSYYRDQNRRWELASALKLLAVLFTESGLYGNHQIEFTTVQEEAQQLLAEALTIFSDLGDRYESEQTREFLGLLAAVQEKYPEAIDHFQTALANLDELGDTISAWNVIYGLVETYQDMGDYASAFESLHAIRRRLEEIGDKTEIANALSLESLIALRYSSLEHARQTRQECLSINQGVDSASGVAWAAWEMGEINRVAGDLAEALEWFEKARLLFMNLGDRTSSVFYERSLGDIAQMTGDYTKALKHFDVSLQEAFETSHEWAQIYALCGMGRAEVALGNADAAMSHLSQALRIARELPYRDMRLLALAGFASLFAATDRCEQAVELGSLVASHKQSWNETKSQMRVLLQSITSLPPERFAAAQERGQALDINEAILRFNL